MKKLNLLLIISFVSIIGKAQTLDWANKFVPISNSFVIANTIVRDENNPYIYLAGNFRGQVDFDPGQDTFNLFGGLYEDAFIVKLDTAGNFIWAESFGGGSHDQAFGISIDNDGNVILSGFYSDFMDCDPGPGSNIIYASSNSDLYVIKLDTAGNFIWVFTNSIGAGRTITDSLNNVFVVSYRNLYKLDPSGIQLFKDSFTTIAFNGITYDNDGFIYIYGHFIDTIDFDPGPGSFNLISSNTTGFIAKYDLSNNLIWAKMLNTVNSAMLIKVVQSESKKLYAIGEFTGICDFNPDTSSYFLTSNGNTDAFLLSLDDGGNFIFASNFGGTMIDRYTALSISKNNKLFVSGYFQDTVDFDFGPGQQISFFNNHADFLAIYDTSANFIQTNVFSNDTGSFCVYSFYNDQDNNLYGTGMFVGNFDIDINNSVYFIQNNYIDVATATFKYTDFLSGFNNIDKLKNGFNIFPNPSTGEFMVKLNNPADFIQGIMVSNIQGQQIKNYKGKLNAEKSLNLSHFAKGEYIIKIKTKSGNEFIKKVLIN